MNRSVQDAREIKSMMGQLQGLQSLNPTPLSETKQNKTNIYITKQHTTKENKRIYRVYIYTSTLGTRSNTQWTNPIAIAHQAWISKPCPCTANQPKDCQRWGCTKPSDHQTKATFITQKTGLGLMNYGKLNDHQTTLSSNCSTTIIQ